MAKKKRKIPFLIKLIAVAVIIRMLPLLIALCMFWSETGHFPLADALERETGIKKEEYNILHEADDHGGFHGDGLYSIALDCSGNAQEIQQITSTWKPLPLTENLQIQLYGGEKNGMLYGGSLGRDAGFPQVRNGSWYFHNRHSEAKDAWDDDIFGQYSCNFSLAIFDSDTNTLYFMAYDT